MMHISYNKKRFFLDSSHLKSHISESIELNRQMIYVEERNKKMPNAPILLIKKIMSRFSKICKQFGVLKLVRLRIEETFRDYLSFPLFPPYRLG